MLLRRRRPPRRTKPSNPECELRATRMFSDFDGFAMTRALALAERGLETTHPNPRVGCVIAQGEEIVGEGWHERAGEAHAEVAAVRAAGARAAGATVYVTLEPCSHYGRTPPCVDTLIGARVARVVFAVEDPNPRVRGRSEEHTSELQSQSNLVCRLLLEKKKRRELTRLLQRYPEKSNNLIR